MRLDILLLFWESYFIDNDKYFILFVVIATLI